MKIKKGTARKLISVLTSFLILVNSFAPYLLIAPVLTPVGAQEEISPTTEPTVVPTQEPSPSEEISPTNEPTIEPTVEVISPTDIVDVSPTIEITPIETIEPTVEPTLAPTEAPSVTSPPEESTPTPASDLQTPAPETTPTATPTYIAQETKIGQVETQVIESFTSVEQIH